MQVKTNKIPRMIFMGVLILILTGGLGLFAEQDPNQRGASQKSLAKPSAERVGRTLSNIGNWSYWIYNTGTSGNNPDGDPGGTYPRGTAALVFTDGLVWGGYVKDAIGLEENPRVGGVTYNEGVQQGWIVTPGDFNTPAVAISPNDERAGMWRIRADYFSLSQEDVRLDAAELNLVDSKSATADMMQDVLDQYTYDYENWPDDLGAPYYDVNNNGVFDKPADGIWWRQVPDPDDPLNMIWEFQGETFDKDGNGEITIGEREAPGIAGADQVLYSVYNDMNEGKTIGFYGSQPMGIELQSTTWAYNQPSATLGQLIFRKYLFINKSGVDMDSMFVSQWSDADIGNYTDDYAGCDTIRSLGYGYSGFVTDPDYTAFNLPPGAVGYDFFQGPLVDGVAGEDLNKNGVDDAVDYGIFGLKNRGPGKINLPMTSYFFFASGSAISDPPLGDYNGTLQWYNLLNGFTPTENLTNPTPYIVGSGPRAGNPTKYPLSGDPTTQQGDVDGLGTNQQPGDRRIGLNSGPFSMAPGDSNEVVVAIIGGIVSQTGGDNRNAVLQMKLNSDFAQFVYDNLFEAIPRAPAAPAVTATAEEVQIVLEWGSDEQAVAATEADDPLLGFNFEGYNIYQLPTETATRDQATLVATFDVVNNITTIYATKFVATVGDIVTVPIQKGTDSGIQRYFTLTQDYVNGTPLFAGNVYYFSVTAYNFSDDPSVPEPSLESGLLPAIAIVPQGTVPGTRYEGFTGETLPITHIEGTSDGEVQVTVIDPAATTGNEYEVFFIEDTDTNSATFGELLWNVADIESGEIKVAGQEQLANFFVRDDLPIFDGLMVKVSGPKQDFKIFMVTQNANGAVDPTEMGTFGFNDNGFPLLVNDLYPFPGSDRPDADRQQANGSTWGIQHNTPDEPDYDDFFPQATGYTGGFGEPAEATGIAFLIPRDYEIRFTETPAPAFYRWPYLDSANPAYMGTVPFELWCIGLDLDDPADDYQCVPWINDEDSSGTFNLLAVDHGVSGGDNDPYSDGIYWVEPISRDKAGYDALLAAHIADPAGANSETLWAYKTAYDPWNSVAGMMRMVFVNWNGGSVADETFPANLDSEMPEPGTIFRIGTSKPNLINDKFAFTAPAVTTSKEDAEVDVEKLNVYPNPYYANNPSEPDRFTRFVTFNHMPEKVDVRIFNLTGVQVRKLEKNSPEQFLQWDLRNEADIPVASGMYIAFIDMPQLGKQKILKIMVIQSQEQLKYY